MREGNFIQLISFAWQKPFLLLLGTLQTRNPQNFNNHKKPLKKITKNFFITTKKMNNSQDPIHSPNSMRQISKVKSVPLLTKSLHINTKALHEIASIMLNSIAVKLSSRTKEENLQERWTGQILLSKLCRNKSRRSKSIMKKSEKASSDPITRKT